MKLGASSSCYYPMQTEKSLEHILQLGFQNTEVFFNAACELEVSFLKKLSRAAQEKQVAICAVHPFTSFAETNCFFSAYYRRFTDMLEFYKRYFEAAQILGATVLVIHGSRLPGIITHEEYFERFDALVQEGKKADVLVAQENVNQFLSQDISFLKEMKAALGDNFHLVFDVKQAVRAGYDPFSFAKEMEESICHIHISDHDDKIDCLPPGRGDFDFGKLIRQMERAHYTGAYMIEIYRKNYNMDEELGFSKSYMESIKL